MNQVKNSVYLIGNLGKDPEMLTLDNGNSITNFSLATNETYRNSKGEKVTTTEWHNCKAWGKLGESISKYLAKGRQVAIQGQLRYNTWEDKQGVKRKTPEIVINDFMILDRPNTASATE